MASEPSPATERTPPTPKGRDTRSRLLSAATELFAERGYSGVRIIDITEAAGLSAGAFYRYFQDRRELMLTLMRQVTEEAFDFVRVPWDENDPMSSVLKSTELYFKFYESHRALFAILVELGQTDADVRKIWATSRSAFYSRIAYSLQRGREAGRVRTDVDINCAAELLGSMTEFYAFQRFVLGDEVITPVSTAESAHNLASIWMSGLIRDNGKSR